MFGHGSFVVEPDFWLGAGVAGVGAVGVVDVVVGAVLDDVVDPVVVAALAVPVAAEAPAIPAAAPPVASAPATIVAPSILDIRMGWNLLGMGVMGLMCRHPC
jgi:formaldehyde-activating enzyme involved in methanogenesis